VTSVFSFLMYDADEVDATFLRSASDNWSRVEQDLFGDDGGIPVSGVRKLAQQVVLRLFTPLGGMAYEPQEGCQLMTDVIAGRVRTSDQARQSFAQSRDAVLSQFDADLRQYPAMPTDEQLAALDLLDVSVQRDALYLSVRVVSVANQAFPLTLPINFD
jgi:hypothetical protein